MNYTIKKVSEMTGLSIPTIRYYDKEGLLPDLQRKESGYRVFSDRDLEAIDLIECFKESGLTIREIRHFMSLVRQGHVPTTRNSHAQCKHGNQQQRNNLLHVIYLF